MPSGWGSPGRRSTDGDDQPANHISNETTNSLPESLSSDELASVLANHRRRYVLHCLKQFRTPMALADLADELVRCETDTSPIAEQDEREHIYISLYHCHLPKLADADLINFDINRKLVEPREGIDKLPLNVGTSVDDTRNKSTDNDQRQ